jgi:hypothetical protein
LPFCPFYFFRDSMENLLLPGSTPKNSSRVFGTSATRKTIFGVSSPNRRLPASCTASVHCPVFSSTQPSLLKSRTPSGHLTLSPAYRDRRGFEIERYALQPRCGAPAEQRRLQPIVGRGLMVLSLYPIQASARKPRGWPLYTFVLFHTDPQRGPPRPTSDS